MNYIASGSAFPIKTVYCSPNVYNINETSITSFHPQTGSKICYTSSGSILNAVLLSTGSIFLLETGYESTVFNPKTGQIRRSLIDSEIIKEVLDISIAGDFIAFALTTGSIALYKYGEEKFDFVKNIYMPEFEGAVSLICAGVSLMDDTLFVYRLISRSLERAELLMDITGPGMSMSHESCILPGIKFPQLSKGILIEDRIAFLAVDGDCVTLVTFHAVTRRFKSCVFKLRNRASTNFFSHLLFGPSYNLNDTLCPSFMLFGPESEVIMGILYTETIKFWNVSSELQDIHSGVYAEDYGLFFCSSLSKSAFLNFDVKGLKLSIIQYADAFLPFCNIVSKTDSNSVYCLSAKKDFIFKLGEGIYLKNRLCTDPLFKGICNIWTLKAHYLDFCHAYILCTTPFGSIIFSIEDSAASDVTGLIGIDRNEPTLCAFNVPGSSYVIHVTPSTISAYDFSKVDSANSNDIIRSEINASSVNGWALACYHQLLLACLARNSKLISFFQIKNRHRDLDIVVPFGTFDCAELVESHEICHISVCSTPGSVLLAVSTDNRDLFLLELNPDLCLKTRKHISLPSPVSSFKFYQSGHDIRFIYGCRDGSWTTADFARINESGMHCQLGSSPLSIMAFLNDSLIIYNDTGAKVISTDAIGQQQPREIFDWQMVSACEFQLRPEEPWIVGIENDCLVMVALNRSRISRLSKKVIFGNGKILCFDYEDPAGNWIIGHQDSDNKYLLSMISSNGSLLFSFDEGIDEPVKICRHTRDNTIIVVTLSKSSSCSKIQIFTIHKERFEIVSEFICGGLIKKALFDNNSIIYCVNDELFGLDICPNFLSFSRRTSFHFRNRILDFDAAGGWVVVSTLSDGLDVLSVVSDAESFAFKHMKGDPFSRSCYACLWKTPGQEAFYCDKSGLIGVVKAVNSSKFLIDDRHWKLNELGTALFSHAGNFFAQTISGGIVKIEE